MKKMVFIYKYKHWNSIIGSIKDLKWDDDILFYCSSKKIGNNIIARMLPFNHYNLTFCELYIIDGDYEFFIYFNIIIHIRCSNS